MAVVVRISINDNHPALHVIEICRVTNIGQPVLDDDAVSAYRVIDYSDHHRPLVTCDHRYGDPVEDLVIKALTALKENREH
jgi:hypothetical protein